MLARRRELILIIGGLLGLNMLMGWLLVRQWKDYRSRTRWVYATGSPLPPATRVAAPAQEAGQPQSFVEIVDRNVYSPLRGHPPPQAEEAAKAPKPPILFGTMNLGTGRFALMAPGDQPSARSKRILPGDEIGGYKLVSIGTSNVVVQWQERKISLDISDSVRQASVEKTASASPRPAAATVTTTGSSSNPGKPGTPYGGNVPPTPPAYGAPPGAPADAPAGTVIGGKQKTVMPSPFGTITRWVDVGTPGVPPSTGGGPNR